MDGPRYRYGYVVDQPYTALRSLNGPRATDKDRTQRKFTTKNLAPTTPDRPAGIAAFSDDNKQSEALLTDAFVGTLLFLLVVDAVGCF
jgi:hypothetical protein